MPTFHIDIAQYYERLLQDRQMAEWAAMCEKPIKQLIARYDLAGKSILSLGSGEAFEEYWFHKAGWRLTLNEISGKIATTLRTIPVGDDRFVIDDAAKWLALSNETFDVVYASSFAPDEHRRESMLVGGRWQTGNDPFSSVLIDAAKRGQVSIFQHYKGGVPNVAVYLKDIRRQFAGSGLRLEEAFCFRHSVKNFPVIASRNKIKKQAQLTTFHGRYHDKTISTDIIRCAPANLQFAMFRAQRILMM
jgi:hypothetical protein